MRAPCVAIAACLAACGGGGTRAPLATTGIDAEIVFCRAERDSPTRGTIRTANRLGLGDTRLPEAAGVETGVRLGPDGNRIVFARERRSNDPASREIYTAVLDGSEIETRLTTNGARDESPCYAAEGERIVFASDRTGHSAIWSMRADGTDPSELWADGSSQEGTDTFEDLVVFSRWNQSDADPRRELWIYDDVSGTATAVTDGGASPGADVPGDADPSFSPDGTKVVFTRTGATGARRLMELDRATRVVRPLGDGQGEDRWPRYSPRGDAIFVARSRPVDGVLGLRLFDVDPDGDDPVAVFLDERFEYPGFDVLPGIGPRPPLGAPTRVDVDRMQGTVAFGSAVLGSMQSLDDADGIGLSILTGVFEDRQVAGLRLDVPLGVDDPTAITRLRVSVRAAVDRTDADTFVRLTLADPAENRNDTVLERTPNGTGFEDYSFTIRGLQDVDRDGRIVLTAIADLPDGMRADWLVDRVTVDVFAP